MSVDISTLPEEFSVSVVSDHAVTDRSTLSSYDIALINQRIHEAGEPEPRLMEPPLPRPVQRVTEALIEKGWFHTGPEGGFRIPRSLMLNIPELGTRRDRVLGLWKRLSPEGRSEWLRAHGISNDSSSTPVRHLMQQIHRYEPGSRDRAFLEQRFGTQPWIPADRVESVPRSPGDCYRWAGDHSSPEARSIKQALILPTMEQGTITGFYRSEERQDAGDPPQPEVEPAPAGESVEWDRHPFRYEQQMKIVLVLADAVPFRSTEEEYPYLFDIKEAGRRTGWPLMHLHGLIRQALDWRLLQSDGDRFYMTDRAESWLADIHPRSALYHRLPLNWGEQQNEVDGWMEDCSGGRVMWSILSRLEGRGEAGFPLDETTSLFADDPTVRAHLAAMPGIDSDPRSHGESVVTSALQYLHWLGFVDGRVEDGNLAAVRMNPRGRELLSGESSDRSGDRELPIILQPDGTVMVPITAPLEDFRRINPYVLLTDVDNMMQFKIDRESLVQALNEGWDAASFREFLTRRSDRIPDPVRELFEDVAEPAEDVDLTRVHHLLRFESGATASKALRALRNYKPQRISETEIILKSKTTEETIRRNLSRGGVRLKQSVGEVRNASPLIELDSDSAG